ncbi:hypothetical protein M422DRAFT_60349 [Sphaerobolus stellatus SS14]|uniref:Cupin type-1 domain-containing protein n=1 Tax=Sphaerobolus stellatus (strain SS14) TaxID=990650 RepID=A0A0C9VVH1_SPHS4|nr:hypothetical protein M422DRAFT_60349 [Sphaerobolus stellatus SS14]
MIHSQFILVTLFWGFGQVALAAPAASQASSSVVTITLVPTSIAHTGTSSAPATTFTAGLTSDDPNDSFLDEFQDGTPEGIRGTLGASILGPQNIPIEREGPDLLAPPSTDSGKLPNAHWPFSLSHSRLQTGGWARQQNAESMPFAEEIAGVNMRLEAGAIRELHWHATAEWGYVLSGTVRISVVTPEGQNYLDDINPGDVWYFPPGVPHSIQATNATADGSEFILVFDSGDFSEDDTFLLTEWVAHVPKEVLAKNFPGSKISDFDDIPANQLYIFPSNPPPPLAQDQVPDPQGHAKSPFSHAWSKDPVTSLAGGSVKILDSTTFTVSKTIAAADVVVEKGGLREMHWHPTQPEWTFFLSGTARITIFAADSNARTFDYQAGDIGYVPPSFGHYVENIGNDTLHYLEIWKTDVFQDISLSQWLALIPPELVKAHLNIDDATVALFNKTKQVVV